jgi:hypothetical protein
MAAVVPIDYFLVLLVWPHVNHLLRHCSHGA